MSARPGWRRRRILGMLAATSLIAIAMLPAVSVTAAPTKIYTLAVTPSSALAGTSTDFFVKVTNKSPGNSNPNSFSVTAPEGFDVTAASISSAANPNPSATVTVVAPSTVEVRFLDALRTNQFVTVKVTATTPSITGCSSVSPAWTAQVFAGSNLSGEEFSLTGPAPVTTLLSCLQLQFVDGFAPTDGTVGSDIPVKVEAVAGGSRVTSFTGQVTIEKVSGPGVLSGNVATASEGLADFPNFQGDTAGDYVVKATSPGVPESSTAAFTLFEETITCGGVVTEGPVTVTWLQNPGGELPPCTTGDTKPVTVSKLGNDVEILSSGEFDATFKVEINAWDPEPAMNPVPATQVTPPEPFHPGLWCDGTPSAPAMPTQEGSSTPESWCLINQNTTTYGPDGDGGPGNPDWVPDYEGQLMQVSETWLLTADAGCRR